MAQNYVSSEGSLTIPGSYASWQVQTQNSGLSTSGVIILMGEADAGPDFTLEESLNENSFGPDEVSEVLAKYRSGPIVDAFRLCAAPANDANITGAPNRILIVKTNASVRATSAIKQYSAIDLEDIDGDVISLADKNYGKTGNMIYWQVRANATEVVPTTGSFTWANNVSGVKCTLRVNGAAVVTPTLSANTTPTAAVSAFNQLAGVAASGGALRTVIPSVTGHLTLAVIGVPGTFPVSITYSGTWNTIPTAGDTLTIPSDSVLCSDNGGQGDAATPHNAGAYVVTSATANVIYCTKVTDGGMTSGAAGLTPTAPTNKPVAATVAATTDINVYSPVVISTGAVVGEAAVPVLGIGKSLEINETGIGQGAGEDLLTWSCRALAVTPVAWISKSGAAAQLTSATEYRADLRVCRQLDNVSESLIAGGEIALKLGYTGTTGQVVIDNALGTAIFTITGGSGTWGLGGVTVTLSDFPTLADLQTFIDSKTGFSCTLGSNLLGQLPPTALDNGTFNFGSTFGNETCRLKIDAYRFFNKVSSESVLVQLQDSNKDVERAAGGLPGPTTTSPLFADWTYLANGAKGGTLAADITAALLACEKVRGNFLVPLFSRDATADILDGLTESTSGYTIAAINAAARSHVLAMSVLKKRRNRQAFLSIKDTFANAKLASANTASYRCAMTFQDIKALGSDGLIHQYAPWMGAVDAAAAQGAAFYKSIFAKFMNISGALQAALDFDDQDDSAMEDALLSGLLPLKRAETGGFQWVSDQTTYGKDNNFVLNSIQAVYVADMIALTCAARMEGAFLGQSLADVSAPLAKAFFEAIMGDFMRLKLITSSDDALKGYKNLRIRISGPSMIVSCEVKLAGCIYFIPVSFLISQVQQSA